MKKPYTCRHGHLESLPDWKVGDLIFQGDKIGRMGTSGQSVFPHDHIDVIEGHINKIIRLKKIGYEPEHIYKPNIKQLNFFIDYELFKFEIVITTPFYDPEYKILWKKDHPAYDVVPKDRKKTKDHFDIYWNRSKTGVILGLGFDDGGYGYYILIGFEA